MLDTKHVAWLILLNNLKGQDIIIYLEFTEEITGLERLGNLPKIIQA